MKKLLYCVASIIIIISFGIFIYPGIYKYDKLEQNYPVKINRLTGSTQILRGNGWQDMNNPQESELQALRVELLNKLEQDRESVKNDIILSIENKIVLEVQNDLNAVKDEITAYKKFETDPNNYFSIGSTKNEVKKIMGVPTSIDEYFNGWYYGTSRITFKNGKVSEYSNDGNLRVK
jgi:hypothetical protein